jgi:serine protease Do
MPRHTERPASVRPWAALSLVSLTAAAAVGCSPAGGQPAEGGQQGAPPPAVRVDSSAPRADSGVVSVARSVTPAVVYIEVESAPRTAARGQGQGVPPGFPRELLPPGFQLPDGPQQRGPARGSGSGFIVSPNGYILTNNHVVADADRVTVTLYDRRIFTARVIGRDPSTDVALIKIDGTGLPTAVLGDDRQVQVGQPVVAIGNPLGLRSTVTSGIVSAKERSSLGELLNNRVRGVGLHPDRRGHQPGQLGRPARRPGRARHRHQLGHPEPHRHLRRLRLRRARGDRAHGDGPVPQVRPRAPRHPRREHQRRAPGRRARRGAQHHQRRARRRRHRRGRARAAGPAAGRRDHRRQQPAHRERGGAAAHRVRLPARADGERHRAALRHAAHVPITLREAPTERTTAAAARPAERAPASAPKLGIGIEPLPAEAVQAGGLPAGTRGLVVRDVDPSGPAAGNLFRDDVITAALGAGGQRPIRTTEDLAAVVRAAPNGVVSLLVATPQGTRVVNLALGQ